MMRITLSYPVRRTHFLIMATSLNVDVCSTQNDVVDALCKLVAAKASNAIQERDIFTVGVSGGSLATYLAQGLPAIETDWSKWRVYFCDERYVPLDHADSTYRVYKEGLMTKVPLKEEQIYKINMDVPVEEAAADYVLKLKYNFGDCDWPVFDLLLLGMGPDGHTCSLFPGHQLLEEDSVWIAPIKDSPKPPPSRITMTFPVINNARHAVFAACGQGKADMVKRVLEGNETPSLPSSRVKSAQVSWILDESAASLLSKANL